MEDKDNAAKASKHFGHAHGHGFHGMHIGAMREAIEKPETYLRPIMEGAEENSRGLVVVLDSIVNIYRSLLNSFTVLMQAPKQ